MRSDLKVWYTMLSTIAYLGAFCVSTQGRDKAKIYIITKVIDAEFVLVADGQVRCLANPKKKRVKHIKVLSEAVDRKLLASLLDGSVVDNELHKAILKIAKKTTA